LVDWVRVEGEVQGGSEERPVGMLVITQQFGSELVPSLKGYGKESGISFRCVAIVLTL
jgi:hypothetical protein